jgi:hypothetical protein
VIWRVVNVEMTFLQQCWVGVSCQGRVTDSSGVDSMFQFQFKRGDDMKKYCRKMKRRQRTHLGYMGMKRDTAWRCDDVGRRRGNIGKRKESRQHQLG